jgi:hypothetical protein
MSEAEKPFDPKATIQVQNDELTEVSGESGASDAGGARPLPPPLPAYVPERSAERSPAQVAPAPGRSVATTILYAAIVLVMLGGAAFGGMKFASFLQGDIANAPSGETTAAPGPAPGTAAAAPAGARTVNLPSVQIR